MPIYFGQTLRMGLGEDTGFLAGNGAGPPTTLMKPSRTANRYWLYRRANLAAPVGIVVYHPMQRTVDRRACRRPCRRGPPPTMRMSKCSGPSVRTPCRRARCLTT